MTDQHAGYIVTLAEDIRSDDAAATLTAIRMVKGVIAVSPIVSEPELHVAEDRARFALEQKLWAALRETK